LAPENTLAAARKGLAAGADLWELDVALSADGIPYLVHDDTLERTSNVAEIFPERRPWRPHQFTLAEIRQLDFGAWFNATDPFGQIAAGNVSAAEQAGYVGEVAPTLEEALTFTRDHDWRVNVELKDLSGTPGDAVIVETVAVLIEQMGMVERVIISSFNHRYLGRAKAANPNLATAALIFEPVVDPVALLRQLQAEALNPNPESIDLTEIAPLRAQGFGVNVWTVNDEALMRRLIEAGASGIFTDFPHVLASILAKCRVEAK
jgi:glycerophosphoryl diester phosphodiesterase